MELEKLYVNDQSYLFVKQTCPPSFQWRIQGRDPALLGPLTFRPNWGPKGPKKFFWRPPSPSYLRVWMTATPPPPLSQSPVPALRYIKRYKQQQNMNWELWYNCKASKFSESTFANIRFSLLQVCPSAPSFVLSVLFIPLFHVLSGYFYVSLSLVALPTIWILINFVTQLL